MKTKVKTKTKAKTFLTEKQIREQARKSFQSGLEMRRYLSIYTDEMQKLRHQHLINQYERRIKELNR
jgi:phosphopantetheine adenylyltransferase